MRRRELIKRLKAAGFIFYCPGGNHDIYIRENQMERITRHKEIDEQLARAILRKWDLWK